MAGKHIELDRQFRTATKEDVEAVPSMFRSKLLGHMTWTEVLEKPRVVLLAEAGSGKSDELKHQSGRLASEGHHAFYGSVRDVAKVGLERAIPPAERAKFEAWRSGEAPAWFFIDSIDEAKDQGEDFEDAVRNLAEAITGREERSRIIISSRFTDWDDGTDRDLMQTWLSTAEPPPPPTNFQDDVRSTFQSKSGSEPKAKDEPIAVLQMLPLDPAQVRRFAEGSGIADSKPFLDAVDHHNLWRFAGRPLDLAWMVEFWRSNTRLGTLREMIEASLSARLLDPDPARRKRDTLDPARCGSALDRIGATFLLCGKDTLRVPGVVIELSRQDASLPVDAVLKDWPDADRLALLGRPVFDPATLGRIRLHGDNERTLTTYLAARWLTALLGSNCPPRTVADLLFADIYGYRLVRPDMAEAAAWLAGTHPGIAEELVSRAPIELLRIADPGSLPTAVRVKAFTAVLRTIDSIDNEKLWFIDSGLRRFAEPALDAHVSDWWTAAGANQEARHLVLQLVQLGQLPSGLGIVRTVAFDHSSDDLTQLLACRVLVTLGKDEDRKRLADYLTTSSGSVPRSVVLELLGKLFPALISVDQFFTLIDAVGVVDVSGHQSILPLGRDLPDGLRDKSDLALFLKHVVDRCGALQEEDGNEESVPGEAFAEMAYEVALRLLGFHPDDMPDAVTDLRMLLHRTNHLGGADDARNLLDEEFRRSPGRRRTSFWRAVAMARTHPWAKDHKDVNEWMLGYLGWPVALGLADADWLLEDVRGRSEAADRMLAMSILHGLSRQIGNADLVERIAAAVAVDEVLSSTLAMWRQPPVETPEMAAQMARMAKLDRKNERHREERDQSWIDLIASLRDDPSAFDNLSEQTNESVDGRLFHLWQFLSWRSRPRNRYSVDSLESVEPIFGSDLTRRFGEALIGFAYKRAATKAAAGTPDAGTTNFDTMALAGMSLAAATTPNWAAGLDPVRAREAGFLATIELNGFPPYLAALAEAHPPIVRDLLMKRVEAHLDNHAPNQHGILDTLQYADPALTRFLADDLVAALAARPDLGTSAVERIVSVLVRGLPADTGKLHALASTRVDSAETHETAALYLLLLFAIEGGSAIDALKTKMATLDAGGRTDLCCTLLPRLAGHRLQRTQSLPTDLPAERLGQLLLLAFEGVRIEDDTERPSGVAYSPDLRDEAQDARSSIFSRLLDTPGEATIASLMRLAEIPDFPIKPEWIRVHARRRAEKDAILAAWQPEDLLTFERTHDRPPTTTADLQLLAQRRIGSIAHDLIEGKFAQGDILKGLPDENSVQRWLATQFEQRQKDSYTVQRETHYADEKEPDLALASRHSGVELPIEVKVVDEMTVAEMEAALETQLCGQYLRHDGIRYGILLLIYQHQRAEGWNLVPGQPLASFDQVLAHLQDMARRIREHSAAGPQPIVATIDVSKVVPLTDKRRIARERKKAAGTPPKKGRPARKTK